MVMNGERRDMDGLVNVLISTYNGEKYIAQQIESIKSQTYPAVRIYVRDDGSSDHTLQILQEYEKRGEIILEKGENIGYGRSFLSLLRMAGEGDYWAFSDQDDVWYPEKIQWSVDWLSRQNPKRPALFGNAYELTSEDLGTVLGTNMPPGYRFDFRRSITDCLYQGFVMTMNRPLRSLMLRGEDQNLISHDWWGVMLAEEYGCSFFDGRIAAKHRRLDSSVSVMSLRNRFKWLRDTFITGNSSIKANAKEFERVFGSRCRRRDARIVHWFTHDSYCLRDSLKKAFYPGRWRPSLSSELVIRFLMLCGRI